MRKRARELKYRDPEAWKRRLEKNLEWKKKNKKKLNKAIRSQHYFKRYGISLEDYEEMLKKQNKKCKICGSEEYGRKSSNYFAVDHCHKTGKVRGLLCHQCNVGLGKFKDNEEILFKAIKYLKGE